MKKPIVIAGNGPSLAQIDYRRLPADFDAFRCNQFYFEDKYFLGKKVTGAFMRLHNIKHQFFNLKTLEHRGEYQIENIYAICPTLNEEKHYIGEDYPEIISCYPYIKAMPEFDKLHQFYWLYYELTFTSTIWMLIIALAQGYKEIYLTGLDFYSGGGQIMLLIQPSLI